MSTIKNKEKVLEYALLGMSNQDIASKIGITVPGVKWHITQLLKQHGLKSRVQLVSAKSCEASSVKRMQSEIDRLNQEIVKYKAEIAELKKYTLPLGRAI
jgi:DNA-binding CsgD family transcriptional regulator